jgi:hypothetical protein
MSIRIFDPLAETPPPAPVRDAGPRRARPLAPSGPPPPAPLGAAPFHGIAGRFVQMIAPHTEADPAALLVQFLVAVGNCLGHGPYYRVEATKHYANEFCAIVGQSSKARKGTSLNWINGLLCQVDDDWAAKCQAHGLVSGEGIIHHVRDDALCPKNGRKIPGITDKRLLIIEEEFGGPLAAVGRKDNTLGSILRSAWDGKNLRTLAKNCGEVATAPHISCIGHITFDELKAKLRGDLLTNGFANRFLWVYARRSRLLPDGGALSPEDLGEFVDPLTSVIETARGYGRITRDDEAGALWRAEYPRLSAERSGTVGAVTSRLEAHAIRLALIYALLDGCPVIRADHLRAALEVCEYSLRSAEYAFGGLSADAQAIYDALQARAPEALARKDICRWVFQNHADSNAIQAALDELDARRLTVREVEPTGGGPRELWRLAN